MKKLLLFTVILTSFLYPQLKEMEVKPTTQRGGIPVNRDNPEKAAIFFYTQFDDLSFWSNYGIVDIKGDPAGGKYIVIVEPVRQTIEVRRKGFKTEMIKIESLQPRDVLYYEVLPKDQGITGVTEVGITVQVSPPDAEISIDGAPVKHDQITPLKLGKHTLSVSKSGYRPYLNEIEVSPTNTFFKVTLEQVKLAQVQILSIPQSAEIRINGDMKGMTDKGLFLFPGDYELSLSKDEYLPVNQNITVSGDEQKNKFTYNLVKNRGNLEITVQPAGATLKINGQITEYKTRFELAPGEYTIEVSKELYLPFTESIKIERGKTVTQQIELFKNRGNLEITVQPAGATLKINGQITEYKTRFELAPGEYTIEVSKELYLPFTESIKIERGKTVTQQIELFKNRGNLELTIQPSGTTLKINGQITEYTPRFELVPGEYTIEVSKELYLPFTETVVINRGETINRKISLTQNFGTLNISTTPAEAKLSLNSNDKPSSGQYDLIPGIYIVELSADRFLPQKDTIKLKSGEIVNKNYSLIKNRGSIALNVLPSNAIVKLNGERITDYRNIEVKPGNYDLEVTADQHLLFSEKFEISLGTMIRRDIKLEKNTGKLLLTTVPEDAIILVNKERQNTNEIELAPGLYELTVKKETYRDQLFTIEIKKGDLISREVKLVAISGSLQFAVSPLDAEVILEKEGRLVESWKGMRIIDAVRIGEYDLTVKSKGYKTIRKSISIKENQTTVEDIQMIAGNDSPEGMVLVDGNSSVKSFLIGKSEVTQALWESVMGNNPSTFKGSGKPVEQISWFDAVEFCNKLSEKEGLQSAYSGNGNSITCDFKVNGYRLPTEEEWEYAARGGNKRKGYDYSGSDDIDEVGWYWSNSGGETKEVGKKQPNELGIYDMSGNVWEWCWDVYSKSNRVLRGGGWLVNTEYCRVFYRDGRDPYTWYFSLGFRLVRTK